MLEDDLSYSCISGEFDSAEYQKAKSAFGYLGSKLKVSTKILSILPPHNCWVELFCGSAALTLAKPAAPIEVINDIDGNIVNVFQQLRNQPGDLIRSIGLTPYSREEYESASNFPSNADDLERARKFLVLTMMSINGVLAGNRGGFSYSNSYSRRELEARVSRWNNFPFRLEAVAKRLRNARIENVDALNLLQKFKKRPATLVYIDPPYFVKRKSGYQHDARGENFHTELLQLCQKSKCMIMISGYESELYNQYLTSNEGWKAKLIPTHTTATCGNKLARDEIVWMNRYASRALDLNRLPIRLSKKEKNERKINPIRQWAK